VTPNVMVVPKIAGKRLKIAENSRNLESCIQIEIGTSEIGVVGVACQI
jgi:hypothetical protein